MTRFRRSGHTAVIFVSPEAARLAAHIAVTLDASLHAPAPLHPYARVYGEGMSSLIGELWADHAAIIGVMASGILVRSIAPHVASKLTDPAIVCVDDVGRFAIGLLSGHEGGANDLAEDLAALLGGTAVVTTGSEARRRVVVGVGSRAGVSEAQVLAAVDAALQETGRGRGHVRALATVDLKASEPGILAAAETLGVPLHVIERDRIRALTEALREPTFAEEAVGVAAVAVPASLLGEGAHAQLLPRQALDGVTIALAEDGWRSEEEER